MEMIDILSKLRQIQENNPNVDVKDAINSVAASNGESNQVAAMDETMTRQHFELFADTLKKIEDVTKRGQTAQVIADVMTKSNPRFERDKFMQAAGVYTVTKGETTDAVAEDSQDDLKKKLDDLKMKYNAQMANAYAGDPDDTEEEMAKIEKQLGITHEGKKMKKDKMSESIMIATDSPEEASMMMQILKLAGVTPVSQNMINQPAAEVPADAQADETYSNTPDPKVSDIKSVLPSGDDLHRAKGAYIKAAGGDNPMAIKMGESEITEEQLSNSLRSQYESFKQTYQEAAKAKPDFLDVDKDGNKAEPMKQAIKDKEGK